MKLEGSCHCGAVTFTVNSRTPYPFNHCYCSKCRKTGGGGYAVNIMGEYETLKVTGAENIAVYRSRKNHRDIYEEDGLGFSRRSFCRTCGTPLWIYNPRYPNAVYPVASAIDTELPKAPAGTHHMLGYKASWIPVPDGPTETHHEFYPEEGIEQWHRSRGLYED
jgi:hypothetical protein